jgi:hypothetical protein
MEAIAHLLVGIFQLGFLASLFYWGITGKQRDGKRLAWIYRIFALAIGSFILFGTAYFVIMEHK